jgi:HK97 family phage major capsid protein
MSEMANRLLEQRANTWEQAKALIDTAVAEKRELTAEEEASYARMTADLDSLRSRADKFAADEQAAADVEASLRSITAQRAEREVPAEESELRSFLRGEKREFVAKPNAAELRDLSKGTATAGGNTVPTSFYGQLWAHLIETAALVNYATVIRTDSGENLEFPTTTAHSSGALTAENAAITESDPAFAKRTLGAYKYATIIQAPRELIDDTGVDLEGYLSMQAGRAVGNALGAHLVTGTGSSQPTGIMTSTTLGVTGGASVSGAFTADNLIDLYYSVISPYRNSSKAAWLMRDATLATVRKLKGSDNNYLWVPGLAGAPDTILGKPVATDPNVAAVALSARSVAFGDMSAYYVRLAGGIRFERSDDFAFNTDQATFRCIVRGDGVLLDQTGAVKHFIGNAA